MHTPATDCRPAKPPWGTDEYEPPGAGPSSAVGLVDLLLNALIVSHEDWSALPDDDRRTIAALTQPEELVARLVANHLLSPFQAEAVRTGAVETLVLGHYRLLELLGQGGMGAVYRAEHVYLRSQVAVKVVLGELADNAAVLHRFSAEARAVARLKHPNIVACLDAGRGGPPRSPVNYFVMEYVAGQNLDALVRDGGPLPPRRACDLFRQIADALSEAHRHGLIHRDIKPPNILVAPDGGAKVLDFGLARIPHHHLTEPGMLLGTVGYMAPEQARDPRGVDPRADLWSIGASLYWALTGREPYPETGDTVEDLRRRFAVIPPPVRAIRSEIPAELSNLVARLMETDPELRYPSARTAAAALAAFAADLPDDAASAGVAAAPRGTPVDSAAATLQRLLPASPTMQATRQPVPVPVPTAVLSSTVSRLLAEIGIVDRSHGDRIGRYVRALAAAVPDHGEYAQLKDAPFLDALAAAAPLHDIGLLAVPRAVLMKPGALDADEVSVLQSHTILGGEVASAVAASFAADAPSLAAAAEVARSHHERWDGTGYPDQLAGTAIPLSARVAALVSVYEALRSRRPHRPAMSDTRVVKLIAENAGSHFDPVLAAAFAAAAARFDHIRTTVCVPG